MNNRVTFEEAVKKLKENEIAFETLTIGENCEIIIVARGARILGPFIDGGESVLWLNKAFKDTTEFKNLIENAEWNLGGDRLWIAPEFTFFCRERLRFDETYTVQNAMDPGSYQFVSDKDEIKLEQQIEVDAFEMPFTKKRYKMSKLIKAASNPLVYLEDTAFDNVTYCGYTQRVGISDLSPENAMDIEPWMLAQINPGGKLLIPYIGDFSFVDYYNPVDSTIQKIADGYVVLNINGKRKYKVAYPSAITTGRAVYVNQLNDGQYYALFRNYYNEPSNPYVCAPWHSPDKRGCSIYVYNDDGETGGFAEFENSGLTINSAVGETDVSAEVTQWLYVGEKQEIERIIYTLIGITYMI